MKVTVEINTFDQLYEQSWSGAREALKTIREAGIEEEAMEYLESILEDCYNNPTDVQLNDLIWFDLLDMLKEEGIYKEEEE